MTLAKVKEQDGMTLAKVKEQDGMTLAKVKEQDGMTVAKVTRPKPHPILKCQVSLHQRLNLIEGFARASCIFRGLCPS